MHKYKDVTKRIIGLLLAICMFGTLFMDVPVSAGTFTDISSATVVLYKDALYTTAVDDNTYTYTGAAIKPYIKVYAADDTLLTNGTDYEITGYTNNTNAGTASITITGTGTYGNTATVNFKINKVKIESLTVKRDSLCLYAGAGGTIPTITSVIGNTTEGDTRTLATSDYTVTYYDNQTIAINNEAYFTIILNDDSNYEYSDSASNTTKYRYSIKYNMNSSTVAVSGLAGLVFTGSNLKPSITVTDSYNAGITSADYLTTWENNTNAGTATLTLIGQNNYSGSKVINFTISQANMSNATIVFDATSYAYTGSAIDMKNHITVYLGTYQVPSSDYTVTYSSSYAGAVGNSGLYVNGINNCTGSKYASFAIYNYLQSASAAQAEYTYTGSNITPAINVYDTTGAKVDAANYTVTYWQDTDATDNVYYNNQVTGMSAVGTYYVRVTGNTDKFYEGTPLGNDTNPISFKIVPKKISDTTFFFNGQEYSDDDAWAYSYSGTTIKPTVAVKEGSTTLTQGTDYAIEFYSAPGCTAGTEIANPTIIGTYYILVTGMGAYAGSTKILHYNIEAKAIAESNLTIEVPDYTYTGSAIVPATDAVVLKNGATVIASSDYTYTCSNNTSIGTATITVTLKGNYSGSKTGTFKIVPKKLADCTYNWTDNASLLTTTYNGSVQTPISNLIIKDGAYTLIKDIDYTIGCYTVSSGGSSYATAGQKNVGNCYVRITGMGNYLGTDTLVLTYTVSAKQITANDVIITPTAPEFDSTADIAGAISIVDSIGTLVEGTDYTVVYYSDAACTSVVTKADSGVVYAKITGKGNYAGTVTTNFKIGTDFAALVGQISVTGAPFTYDTTTKYDSITSGIIVKDKSGETIDADKYVISYYADNTYTTPITAQDNALFINAGKVYIKVTGKNGYYGEYKSYCTISPRSINGFTAVVNGTYTFSGYAVIPQIQTESNPGITLNYVGVSGNPTLTSSDYTIASYANNINVGTNTATVTLQGQGNYTGTKTVTYSILSKDINALDNVTATVQSAVFNGQARSADVSVKYGATGNSSLVLGTDFSIEYYTDSSYQTKATTAQRINAGTLYVKITGIGNYKNVLAGAFPFVITACDMSNTTNTLEGKTFYFSKITNTSKIPSFTVSCGSYNLVAGTDYTCSPSSVEYNIGDQIIRVTGTGNFTGYVDITYAYLGDLATDIDVTGVDASYEYTGSPIQPVIVINDHSTNAQIISNSSFDITYSNSTSAGEATVTVRPKSGEEYWTGSYVKKYKITGDIQGAEISIPTQTYTGEAITSLPGMSVDCNGYKNLILGTDYTIDSFSNNKEASVGTATVTIKGTGDYFGGHTTSTATATFDIKYDIAKTTRSAVGAQTWTGQAVTPDITVSYATANGTKTLTKDTDFVLTYYNNTSMGQANGTSGPYIEIKPTTTGLLTGDPIIVPFTIGAVDINEAAGGAITGVEDNYIYIGETIKPSTMIVTSNGTTIGSTNYNVAYVMTNVTNSATIAATETITVTGKGTYNGTLTKTFNILKRDLSDTSQAKVTIADLTYTGSALEPSFDVVYTDYDGNEKKLYKGSDYKITGYHNNTDAAVSNGTTGPYIEITAYGNNCIGTQIIPFTILPKDMATLYYSSLTNPVYLVGVHAYEPAVTVKMAQNSLKTLTKGTDYSITYYNNTEVLAGDSSTPANGPYMEIVPVSSNYKGSKIISYSITARSLNDTNITVQLKDNYDSTYNETERNYPFDITNPAKVYTPIPVLMDGEVQLIEGTDYDVVYANNAQVGTATITITGKGNYAGTRKEEFTIGTLMRDEGTNAKVVIESGILDGVTTLTYNGLAQKLGDDLQIYKKENGAKSTKLVMAATGVTTPDYSVAYYSDAACTIVSDCVHAGTVYVKITGEAAGGYVGYLVKSYTIAQKSMNLDDINVETASSVIYDGGPATLPAVVVKDTVLGTTISTAEYTLTYKNNTKIGTGTVLVSGTVNGNYSGTTSKDFKITQSDIANAKVTIDQDQIYTGSALTPKPTIYYNGYLLTEGVDYKLTYGNNVNTGLIEQPARPDQAWVKIQGIGNYTGTQETYFNIYADLNTATVQTVLSQIYTGKEVTPAVAVKCGGNTLVSGKDYEVAYTNNIAIGDGTITITPTQNSCYTGSKVVKFTICNDISQATVIGIPTAQTYTGEAIVPTPVVKIGTTVLTNGTDYKVQWRNNINIGTASIVITGAGRYAGSTTVTYRIIAKGITRSTVAGISDITYDTKSHSPNIVVRDGNKVLAKGTDYTVTYANNKLPGTASATIIGRGNYSGTIVEKFNIVVAPITGLKSTESTTSVKLSWTKKSNITGYQVYTKNSRTRVASTTKTYATISKLEIGKTYSYKVRTYVKIGKKTYYGAFQTITFTTKPAQVTANKVTSTKSKEAKVTWEKVSGVSGYVIYRSTSATKSFKKIKTITKSSTVSYTNKKLKSKRTYYYKICAYRTVDGKKVYGSYSKVISVKVK